MYKSQSAFTLLELIIVISIIAMVYTIALPQLNLATGTEITTKMGQLTSDVRTAFDRAVLSGKTHRLVFELLSGNYWLEETEQRDVTMGGDLLDHDPTEREIEELKAQFEERFKQYEEAAGREVLDPVSEKYIKPASPLLAAKDKLMPPDWTKVSDLEWRSRALGSYLIIQDFQAEHHREKQTFEALGKEAVGMIYFFPSGYVEKAVIHIAMREGNSGINDKEPGYTFETEPFEGVATVNKGYQEVDVRDDEK